MKFTFCPEIANYLVCHQRFHRTLAFAVCCMHCVLLYSVAIALRTSVLFPNAFALFTTHMIYWSVFWLFLAISCSDYPTHVWHQFINRNHFWNMSFRGHNCVMVIAKSNLCSKYLLPSHFVVHIIPQDTELSWNWIIRTIHSILKVKGGGDMNTGGTYLSAFYLSTYLSRCEWLSC